MSRYIDADLIEYKEIFVPMLDGMMVRTKKLDGLYAKREDIEGLSTADVQEVKHGRWKYKTLDNFRKVECTCTHCGWSGVENYDSYVDISDFEYCPNCGAKMDGGESK